MRDIARMAGVSHVSVSLALRNHPRISVEMKARIHELCREHGYRRDPMLSALAHYRRTKADTPVREGIAWINSWPNPDDLRQHREFDLYWKGANDAAAKFGYRLEEIRFGRDISPRRLHQIVTSRGIRGLLLPPHQIAPDWGDFPWLDYSVVRFGRSLKQPDTHLVTADQVSSTMLAMNSIRARGYRRIGFVCDEPYDRSHGILFSAGYLSAGFRQPQKDHIPLLDVSGLDSRAYGEALQAWIRKHRVEAIFTNRSELMAMLAKLDIRVPDDVAVAVTSVLDGNADAGIDQHPEEIGRVGFLMLHSLINDSARGIPDIKRQVVVQGSWVDGWSLPDRR